MSSWRSCAVIRFFFLPNAVLVMRLGCESWGIYNQSQAWFNRLCIKRVYFYCLVVAFRLLIRFSASPRWSYYGFCARDVFLPHTSMRCLCQSCQTQAHNIFGLFLIVLMNINCVGAFAASMAHEHHYDVAWCAGGV